MIDQLFDTRSPNATVDWQFRNSPDQTTLYRGPNLDEVLPLDPHIPQLREDESGTFRVGKSRITFDLVIEEHQDGMSPEEMVRAYDTLAIADVQAVIAYYERNRAQVQSYLKRREEEADTLRAKIEAQRPRISREELLARRRATEKDDAPTGQ
jgi:uncharacterized protein (DUF433 family)